MFEREPTEAPDSGADEQQEGTPESGAVDEQTERADK